MKKIGIDCQMELLQKGSLLVTTRIIQEVMTLLEPVENVIPPTACHVWLAGHALIIKY